MPGSGPSVRRNYLGRGTAMESEEGLDRRFRLFSTRLQHLNKAHPVQQVVTTILYSPVRDTLNMAGLNAVNQPRDFGPLPTPLVILAVAPQLPGDAPVR